jgi:hypothetical protein
MEASTRFKAGASPVTLMFSVTEPTFSRTLAVAGVFTSN